MARNGFQVILDIKTSHAILLRFSLVMVREQVPQEERLYMQV